MKAVRRILTRVLLLLALVMPTSLGCGTNAPPGGSPSAPSTMTTASPAPRATSSRAPTAGPTQPVPTASESAPGPGWTVASSRVAYQWRWPGGAVTVNHAYPVPPVAELVSVGAGNHPNDPGDRPYNRMSFSFTTAYPTYIFEYVDHLIADGSGQPIPLAGLGVVRIEGHVSYGIGIAWQYPHSNPHIAVRVYEVTYANSQGEHRYVIAFDVDAR